MSVTVGARSAFDQAVRERQKQLAQQYGKKDRIIQPKEIEALAAEFFGEMQIPEGVKILSQTPMEVTYETADGKQYRQFRNLSASLAGDVGRVETKLLSSPINSQSKAREGDLASQLSTQMEELNKLYAQQAASVAKGEIPAGLQTKTSNYLNQLDSIIGQLSQKPTLGSLDPEVAGLLSQISDAQQQTLNQQFQADQGNLVAQLFGRGVNASSIAGDQANRLLQGQGLVRSQALSDAAQRELAVRQFLSQLGQQNLALAGQTALEAGDLGLRDFTSVQGIAGQNAGRSQQLYVDLLNNLLQREMGGEQLRLGARELDIKEEQGRESNLLQRDAFEQQASEQRKARRAAMVNSIIGGIASIGLGMATGGLGSGLGGLLGGGSSAAASNLPAMTAATATGG